MCIARNYYKHQLIVQKSYRKYSKWSKGIGISLLNIRTKVIPVLVFTVSDDAKQLHMKKLFSKEASLGYKIC